MNLERLIEFEPAWDRRDPDPRQDGGINGVQLRFVLKGERGAVQFLLLTNWQLPHVAREFEKRPGLMPAVFFRPMPADLGYHSPKPMYEGHRAMGSVRTRFDHEKLMQLRPGGPTLPEITQTETGTFTPCPYLNNGPCYYDGSGLNAEPVFEALLVEGHEGVWRNLENYYRSVFKSEES